MANANPECAIEWLMLNSKLKTERQLNLKHEPTALEVPLVFKIDRLQD